jgi:hypothetical protein
MPFEMTKDRIWSAIDRETHARMLIDSGPEIEWLKVKFASPEISLQMRLAIEPKFADRQVRDTTNPGIMINAGQLNHLMESKQFTGYDFEQKSRFVEYLIRMMAFINSHSRLATAPYFWSDYDDYLSGRKGPLKFVFRMPSDDELLRISLQTE